MKISAVYKIVNTITGDSYIGSSKDVRQRLTEHKSPSVWNKHLNSLLYKDMQNYGVDKFRFQILAPVMPEYLKQVEQGFIEMLHPTYNDKNAKGTNVERRKRSKRKYAQSEKGKEVHRKSCKNHYNQLCSYNGETITLNTLSARFYRAGLEHCVLEAKKYLLSKQ